MSRAPISLAFYYPCMICTLVSQAGGQKKSESGGKNESDKDREGVKEH